MYFSSLANSPGEQSVFTWAGRPKLFIYYKEWDLCKLHKAGELQSGTDLRVIFAGRLSSESTFLPTTETEECSSFLTLRFSMLLNQLMAMPPRDERTQSPESFLLLNSCLLSHQGLLRSCSLLPGSKWTSRETHISPQRFSQPSFSAHGFPFPGVCVCFATTGLPSVTFCNKSLLLCYHLPKVVGSSRYVMGWP